MRCITIRQPWATLIAIQEKRFETRGWMTRYRGELAIHAGKQIDKEVCREEPIRSLLAAHGLTAEVLPTGAFVAVCRLADCHPVLDNDGETAILGQRERIVNGQEYGFGDFAIGRYAWELTEMHKLQEPVPAVGKQGIWNWAGNLGI